MILEGGIAGDVNHGLNMKSPILPVSEFQAECGRRLKALIHCLGITQTAAAGIMGITKHVLRNWTAGDNPVQPYPLYRLCVSQGVGFNFVFLGDWSRLPYEVARKLGDELRSAQAVSTEAADLAGENDGPAARKKAAKFSSKKKVPIR